MKNIFTALFVIATVGVSAQNLGDSLIAEYLFNKNLEDKSSNGFDLTNMNGVFVADRNGKDSGAIYLNGTNAYLARTNESAFFAPEFSYSAWIKLDGMPPNGAAKAILSTGGTIKDNGISINNNYLGQTTGLGVWTYLSATQTVSFVMLPTYNDQGWHHVMSTSNDDSIKMYLDGVHIGSDHTGDIAGYTGTAQGFYLGCRTGNTQFFKGTVDDVRIWTRALDAGEVVLVYNGMFSSAKEVSANPFDVTIFPNPSTGSVSLKRISAEEPLLVKVYSALGQIVVERSFEETNLSFTVNTPGVYYIVVSNADGVNYPTQKVVVN